MVSSPLPTSDGYSGPPGSPSVDPDAALMLLGRDSVDAAFSTIVRRHEGSLLSFFQRQGAREDSPDLAQETFIRLYRYRDRYQATSKFTSFLYTLARNAWADHGRKVMRRERLADAYSQESEVREFNLFNPTLEADSGVDLETAKSSLSPKHRQVIDLYFYQGLRLQEISTRLDIPLGTVKSRLNHALRDLRTHVQAAHEAEHGSSRPLPQHTSRAGQVRAALLRAMMPLWGWATMSFESLAPAMI